MKKLFTASLDAIGTVAILHGAYLIHPSVGWLTLGFISWALAHSLRNQNK